MQRFGGVTPGNGNVAKKNNTDKPVYKFAYRRHDLVPAMSLGLRTVDELIATGKLKSVRVGACRLVTARQLEAFFAALEASQSSEPEAKSRGRKPSPRNE
jgi:hypothetical protein